MQTSRMLRQLEERHRGREGQKSLTGPFLGLRKGFLNERKTAVSWPELGGKQCQKESCISKFDYPLNLRRHMWKHGDETYEAEKQKKRTEFVDFWNKLEAEKTHDIVAIRNLRLPELLLNLQTDDMVESLMGNLKVLDKNTRITVVTLVNAVQGLVSLSSKTLLRILDHLSGGNFLHGTLVPDMHQIVCEHANRMYGCQSENLPALLGFLVEYSVVKAWDDYVNDMEEKARGHVEQEKKKRQKSASKQKEPSKSKEAKEVSHGQSAVKKEKTTESLLKHRQDAFEQATTYEQAISVAVPLSNRLTAESDENLNSVSSLSNPLIVNERIDSDIHSSSMQSPLPVNEDRPRQLTPLTVPIPVHVSECENYTLLNSLTSKGEAISNAYSTSSEAAIPSDHFAKDDWQPVISKRSQRHRGGMAIPGSSPGQRGRNKQSSSHEVGGLPSIQCPSNRLEIRKKNERQYDTKHQQHTPPKMSLETRRPSDSIDISTTVPKGFRWQPNTHSLKPQSEGVTHKEAVSVSKAPGFSEVAGASSVDGQSTDDCTTVAAETPAFGPHFLAPGIQVLGSQIWDKEAWKITFGEITVDSLETNINRQGMEDALSHGDAPPKAADRTEINIASQKMQLVGSHGAIPPKDAEGSAYNRGSHSEVPPPEDARANVYEVVQGEGWNSAMNAPHHTLGDSHSLGSNSHPNVTEADHVNEENAGSSDRVAQDAARTTNVDDVQNFGEIYREFRKCLQKRWMVASTSPYCIDLERYEASWDSTMHIWARFWCASAITYPQCTGFKNIAANYILSERWTGDIVSALTYLSWTPVHLQIQEELGSTVDLPFNQ
ncbi:hypothetical protein GOP47_0000392 [Adiantum capillus-veneris]|uniref:C2H2-type domain-containing protein n=1 Tax=Adiantum capillus-veneris TaxID=13818 RepID=A0A9D4VDG0_ADICA|nr:hypothetical protein GOP47_0000392 [Adiantum capillus-veneris]